jgi:hypothetical protein
LVLGARDPLILALLIALNREIPDVQSALKIVVAVEIGTADCEAEQRASCDRNRTGALNVEAG